MKGNEDLNELFHLFVVCLLMEIKPTQANLDVCVYRHVCVWCVCVWVQVFLMAACEFVRSWRDDVQ